MDNFTIENDKVVQKFLTDLICKSTHHLENSTVLLIAFICMYIIKIIYDIYKRHAAGT